MRYYKVNSGVYLLSIGTGGNTGKEISEWQYNEILSILRSCPEAPEGYAYRLTEYLEWELYEQPIEEIEEAATEADYKDALREMGVMV